MYSRKYPIDWNEREEIELAKVSAWECRSNTHVELCAVGIRSMENRMIL